MAYGLFVAEVGDEGRSSGDCMVVVVVARREEEEEEKLNSKKV